MIFRLWRSFNKCMMEKSKVKTSATTMRLLLLCKTDLKQFRWPDEKATLTTETCIYEISFLLPVSKLDNKRSN